MTTHYEKCLAHVRSYHADLVRSTVNRSAIEGLVESYLEQPAYSGYRDELRSAALSKPVV